MKFNPQPVIDKCAGCQEVKEDGTCKSYETPEAKWSAGNCPRASHKQKEVEKEKEVNPIKASKRKMAGR